MVDNSPRPHQIGQMSSADIADTVRTGELRDIVKVYAKQFVHAYTGTVHGCKDFFDKNFAGRLLDEDWEIIQPFVGSRHHWLRIRIWNVMGEFKHIEHAEAWVEQNFEDVGLCYIVTRASRAEVELRDYGIKRMVGPRAQARSET